MRTHTGEKPYGCLTNIQHHVILCEESYTVITSVENNKTNVEISETLITVNAEISEYQF